MTVAQAATAVVVLVVVAAYATLAVRWTASGSQWYAHLARPSWQPPDVVFGVVWPLSFAALAVAGVAVAVEGPPRSALTWVLALTLSVALAVGWARDFYVAHRLGRAAVLLAGAAALTWGLVGLSAGLLPWTALLLAPYAGWLSIATTLAVGYWRLAAERFPRPA